MRVFFHAFSSPLPVLTEMFTTDREHPDFPAKENPAKKTMCLSVPFLKNMTESSPKPRGATIEEFQAQVIVNTQKGILLVSAFFRKKEKMTRIQKIPTCAVR